jgi:hypothetical protein
VQHIGVGDEGRTGRRDPGAFQQNGNLTTPASPSHSSVIRRFDSAPRVRSKRVPQPGRPGTR